MLSASVPLGASPSALLTGPSGQEHANRQMDTELRIPAMMRKYCIDLPNQNPILNLSKTMRSKHSSLCEAKDKPLAKSYSTLFT